jgi:hypothetical protein
MKPLKFLLALLLLLFFIDGGLNAQTVEKTGTATITFPIRCDGVIIDILKGTAVQTFLTHYKEGKVDWIKSYFEDINLVSMLTKERFDVTFHQKQSGIFLNEKIIEIQIHYNCVGEWGSHYIISETFQDDFNTTPPVHTIIRQECKCW